jgi:pimeloyl-ACP methyl ester carboxylesterase
MLVPSPTPKGETAMRSISRSATFSQNVAVVLAGAVLIAAPTGVGAQVKRDAQGAWGGKTNGVGHYADVNGIKLYYESIGTGKPLILLHGGLGAIEMFGPNLPALANGRQVVAVDLQGHGRTADIDRPLSVELMADDIAALIRHLKLDRPDVMGYSLGGGVALQTAIRHPEVVGKLVVVSTPFRRDAFYPEILAQQVQISAAMVEAMKPTPMYALYASLAPRPEDFPRLLEKISAAMKKDFDFSKEIAGIKATTLIVAGDADIFPPAHAVEMFGLLGGGKRDGGWDGSGRPKSRLAVLPGLTHYTIFSAPALASTVIPFLDEPTPKGQ